MGNRVSSITTGIGDKGNTKLWSGQDVRKTDDRIEFCGTVDELVSQLGVAYSLSTDEYSLLYQIEYIQRKIFTLASEVATKEPKRSKIPNKIDIDEVSFLESEMQKVERKIDPAKGWILPGKTQISSHLDVARCVARRCERQYIKVLDAGLVENEQGLIWLNRISDYLYLLARYSEKNMYRMINGNG